MNKKTDYVAWGLDDATPNDIDESLAKREQLFKKITGRLDRLLFFVAVTSIAQIILAAIIFAKL